MSIKHKCDKPCEIILLGSLEDITMTRNPNAWPVSTILIMAFGGLLLAVGVYFLVLRPALLPEDLRYMHASEAQLQSVAPLLSVWLARVFLVMGGYIAASGILTVVLAATAFRRRDPIATLGLVIAGLSSIGLMAAVNFNIDSDFKWQLLAIALVWAAGMGSFVLEYLRLRNSRP
jgi:hypothetical protein